MPPQKRAKSPLPLAPARPVAQKKTASGSGWVWAVAAVAVCGGAWYFFNNYTVRRVATHEKTATLTASTVKAPAKLQDVAAVTVDVVAVKKSEALAELITFRYIKDADSLNALDKDNYTPLMRAALRGDLHVAQLLVDAGAEVDFINPQGLTALLVSIPQFDSQYKTGLEMTRLLIAAGADVNFHRFDIITPLAWAASCGTREAVQLLLASGADVHFVDGRGHDALFYARKGNNAGAVEVLEHAAAKK